jgi:hypothetical protein
MNTSKLPYGKPGRARKCTSCGRLFTPKGNPKTCSWACAVDQRRRKMPKPYTGPCKVCGKQCPAERSNGKPRIGLVSRTCSRACVNAIVNARRINPESWREGPCTHCGKAVRRRKEFARGKAGRMFCSPECSREYQRGANASAWRGGIGGSALNRGKGWRRRAERIRLRDGNKCRRCGKTQDENGGRKLSVDHVRPWREFSDDRKEEANRDENLVSLCMSCHAIKQALENRWLKGDGLALQEYRRSVGLTA